MTARSDSEYIAEIKATHRLRLRSAVIHLLLAVIIGGCTFALSVFAFWFTNVESPEASDAVTSGLAMGIAMGIGIGFGIHGTITQLITVLVRLRGNRTEQLLLAYHDMILEQEAASEVPPTNRPSTAAMPVASRPLKP